MRLSLINIQQTTILTINGQKESRKIPEDIASRTTPNTNQISIFNSHIDLSPFPSLLPTIQTLTIRKATISNHIQCKISGLNLKNVELTFCQLTSVPKIESNSLVKLNLSHNLIREVRQIPSPLTLRALDLRNNRITSITYRIFSLPDLTVIHQFISGVNEGILGLQTDQRGMLDMDDLIESEVVRWDNERVIEICENLVQNDNELMMSQLVDYLDHRLIDTIFDLARKRNKRSILSLLVEKEKIVHFTLEDRIMLMLPALLPYQMLKMAPLELLIKALNQFKDMSSAFFEHVQRECKGDNLFIRSEKDIINFMSLSLKYPHDHEISFLLTQSRFFIDYDFDNRAVIRYLLHLDSLQLFGFFIQNPRFREMIMISQSFRGMVRPKSRLIKMLWKVRKQSMKEHFNSSNSWYYPEYRERKTFCLKNDLFDYQILKEYEQMQCSYVKKDLKYTIKFYNKGNELSLAKKMQTQLKKHSIRGIKKSIALHSTCNTSLVN